MALCGCSVKWQLLKGEHDTWRFPHWGDTAENCFSEFTPQSWDITITYYNLFNYAVTMLIYLLVGGLEHFLFFYILGIVIPID